MRTTDRHWQRVRYLLTSLERCVEACARLDAYRYQEPEDGAGHHYEDNVKRAAVCRRLDLLEARVMKELTRVTVERLDAELARAKKWDAEDRQKQVFE